MTDNTPAPPTSRKKGLHGYRATVAVAMSNYIEAGSIIALATSLSMWQDRFSLSNLAIGLAAVYRRRWTSVAGGLFVVYVVMGLAVAAIKAFLGGR